MEEFATLRERMVEEQIIARGVKDKKVIEVMKKVPRHLFVPEEYREYSYDDEPLPIGEGQTISQPYIVAYMTEVLELKEDDKVLEIGTGSGYQTAILAEIVKEVYTVEIIESLSKKAQKVLKELGYKNIHFKIGDGTYGWKEYSPYNAILVTAAPSKIPESLQNQLDDGGRMIIPVGSFFQELVLVVRQKNKFKKKKLIPVRFVPLVSTH
ncbi:protein-L-isoaspartate(D-aspartate) O-methyltransferase [SCandidatus Aminicenantes bacterium Aminicenantia_JdfR_composite]|jgi:protein-L-isoaspartate(D-aspartate) O-methyltransferase|nr:protein-L-isoaspartate(D-aspartate) O-methyltransferase [SCandidatus Aminicenantes bacterium Aminicenantia_JdfR_composite]MCP2597044.1 protein-L-isoaspartate(D-aspartate) O-methyltransferase [Candidatus Aminicenantes bacterium AC-335-G13]MCP2597998.1 protein-L-isoaspartate(D-aspartate) O-methyltransferase [Candidatus Aminicenantes bacterium AC-335-L06]MCP2605650.1 protein-L-isoaspartate(D-aspartate) O-methyltransferase [Candidatus Aminicenantes bacterium AC-335-O07]MCP2606175.1 protein-L-iso